ncbi:MAG: hypothetical protein KIT31_07250 [Deltaproteobacteria bacterium]|nr:hypothetical protein [Deltaproteobacteria bacterium]
MRTRVVDRNGFVWAALAWDGERLRRLEVPGAVVEGEVIEDALLGRAHRVGETAVSAIAWARPTEIPAIAAPGLLAAGSGGAIMNAIALLAEDVGVAALRYAGPYPTSALWGTLARSFATAGTEEAFTRGLWERAARLAREPIAIDFAPAPHARLKVERGHVELRAGVVERAVIDGVVYAPGGSPARLVARSCEVWFGDAPYARVAELAEDGEVIGEVRALPACESRVVGAAFPAELAEAIAELAAELAPVPLAAGVQQVIATRRIVWADLGARAASVTPDGIAVHAALWERVAPHGLSRLALALAEALAPIAAGLVVRTVLSSARRSA